MTATLIVALIAAIAAIVAPLISALITTHSAYKLKTIDLLFNAKLDAYKEFTNVAFSIQSDPTIGKLQELHKAWSYASLFSSPSTRKKLNRYCKSVIPPFNGDVDEDLDELSTSLIIAIEAMHNELHNFKDYHKQHDNS